ncbi:hypothetical protein QFZ73_003049 [Peribacillus sp. V2I11]|nr:hypothetical protein [Peribacillus sp. V2I11]
MQSILKSFLEYAQLLAATFKIHLLLFNIRTLMCVWFILFIPLLYKSVDCYSYVYIMMNLVNLIRKLT